MVLITGGANGEVGDSTIFVRKNRENLTPPIWFMQPEIEFPKDRSPHEISCAERSESEPQVHFANNTTATVMLNFLYVVNELKFTKIYFDISRGKMSTLDTRKITKEI